MIILGFISSIEIIIILAIILFFTIIPIIALVDIIRSEFKGSNDKLIWVLIVIFTWLIGAILYFILGQKQKTNRRE